MLKRIEKLLWVAGSLGILVSASIGLGAPAWAVAAATAEERPDPLAGSASADRLPGDAGSDSEGRETESDRSGWSPSRLAAHLGALAGAALPDRIGEMRIDEIDLRAPLYAGTSRTALDLGAGTIEGTAPPNTEGNLGVAGHRDGFFRGLRHIEPGHVIEVDTPGGTRAYRVVETLVVEPEDVWVLDPTETATITLVTCHPFYFLGSAPERFIVRGELIEDHTQSNTESSTDV